MGVKVAPCARNCVSFVQHLMTSHEFFQRSASQDRILYNARGLETRHFGHVPATAGHGDVRGAARVVSFVPTVSHCFIHVKGLSKFVLYVNCAEDPFWIILASEHLDNRIQEQKHSWSLKASECQASLCLTLRLMKMSTVKSQEKDHVLPTCMSLIQSRG